MATKVTDDADLPMPSKITDRKFIRMPAVEKVIESDDEWAKCGKWKIYGFKDGLHQDEVWIKLQSLLKDDTLLMIKSSTAKLVGGVILCYTTSEKSKIRQAAVSIQNLIQHDSIMFNKQNGEWRPPRLAAEQNCFIKFRYMYTPMGRLYEKDGDGRWTLVKNEEDNKEHENFEEWFAALEEGIAAISLSEFKTLTVEEKLNLIQPDVTSSELDYWHLKCNVIYKGDDGLTEMERVQRAAIELFDRGVFPKITSEESIDSMGCIFYFYVPPECKDKEDILKYADELRKAFIYPHPMFFTEFKNLTGDYRMKFMYTAENELFENIYHKVYGFTWKAIPGT